MHLKTVNKVSEILEEHLLGSLCLGIPQATSNFIKKLIHAQVFCPIIRDTVFKEKLFNNLTI